MRRPLFAVAGALLASLWFAIELALPDFSGTIDRARVTRDQGCAFSVRLPKAPWWPLITFRADGPNNQMASRLRLFEDGAVLGPAHALHAQIRDEGGGAYSHWVGALWFSASDCSDLATTGRQYTYTVPFASTVLTEGAAIVGAFFILSVVLPAARRRQLRDAAARWLPRLMEPSGILSTTSRGAWVSALFVAASWAYLCLVWGRAGTVSLSLASIYPISDAQGYWVCANGLLDEGSFGQPGFLSREWCQRRPIYSTLLASIIGVSGRSIVPSLLAQAALIAIALAILLRRAERAVGVCGAMAGCAVLGLFALHHAIPVTMTEAAGLIFGCLGLAALLYAAEAKSSLAVFFGAALMSIALNARAGAFLVLPALVLWSITGARASGGRLGSWVAAAVAGCGTGFLLQAGLIYSSGGEILQAHGNLSYTVYGLAVGGKGWSQAFVDHPELLASGITDAQLSRRVYALAFERIAGDPATFALALSRNFSLYLGARPFLALSSWLLGPLLQFSWWLGIVAIVKQRREISAQLVGWCSLGAVCSAPLLIQDGGARVFAATVGIDALQIGMGIRLALQLVARLANQGVQRADSIPPLGWRYEGGVLVLLTAALAFPHIPLGRSLALPRVSAPPCTDASITVVTRIGRESVLLDSTGNEAGRGFWRGSVNADALRDGIPRSEWFAKDAATGGPRSLLGGVQRNPADRTAPGPYNVVTEKSLSEYFGRTVRICLSPDDVTRLFDTKYFRLQSVTVLPD